MKRSTIISFGASLLAALAPSLPVMAQSDGRVLIVDADAGAIPPTSYGTLFNVDLSQPSASAPRIEAAADAGAPFQYLSGVAVSPVDGRAYMADWGIDLGVGNPPVPKIVAVDGRTGSVVVIAQGAPLVQPLGLAFLPDGRLVVADWEADPAGLGADGYGGVGHGALFVIDVPACTPPCTPTVLSDGRIHPFGASVRTAFEDPVAVAYDPVRSTLYVVDLNSPSAVGLPTSLYAVDPTTGRVTLEAANASWTTLIGVEVRRDGTPVVLDSGIAAGDSSIWQVDVTGPVDVNATIFSSGSQYSYLEDLAIDPVTDRVFAIDSGEWNSSTGSFDVPPRLFWIDESITDTTANAVIANESAAFLTPVQATFVPPPTVTSVSPSTVGSAVNVVMYGSGLFPWTSIDLGPRLAVSNVDWAPAQPRGTAIQALLTPTAAAVVPPGCGTGIAVDLATRNPFDSKSTLVSAVTVTGTTGGIVPGPPGSTLGDANRDGIVDGLDLALLGMHFGMVYCDGFSFYNDADFNDDDTIDGADLAILATWFGTRP